MYVILIRFDGPMWKYEYIVVSDCTEEEVQIKTKEIYEANKSRFSSLEVRLVKGELITAYFLVEP
jgi:hypothetical protein